ncbi:predicted protein [Nematostella vectensis]|uniref:Uncharacterized protein n=1 Tax=Nematostella vectensis TaxID=45351 RepID=A7RMS6_NEMVE|nr:cdc42-interacting protein 4 homolog [Nematostella vectensis]EDO47148.1 predicted protein [Nematostella vectensis]|eukprot:XP_001639211.1 predicted protein [Nematostella vectensis]
MTWGKELWDQFELVKEHTHNGIEYVDRVYKFVKERSSIEANYARELRKLAKNFQPKKKAEEELKFTFHKGFFDVVKETDDIAGQHELIVENLNSSVLKELQDLHSELKTDRKKHILEGIKVQDALQQSMKMLDGSKKAYEKAKSEAEQALAAFQRADQDMSMTKLQVEKFKGTSMEKGQAADRARDEYRNQLEKTNSKQTLHYSSEMPAVFSELQTMEENRIKRVGELLTEYSDIECRVMPIVQTCLDNIKKVAASFNGPQDSLLLIEQNRTALQPPGDIEFEEFGKAQTIQRPGQSTTPKDSNKKKGKSKNFFRKLKKVEGDGNDFQSLPPGQKIRICKKKVSEYESQFSQLQASREAMVKMVGVYQQNPALGDVASVEQQLAENAKELDTVGDELFKYQSYLAILENKEAPPKPQKYSKSAVQPPPAPVDEQQPGPPPAPSLLVPPMEEADVEDGEFDEEQRCKILYDFQGTNEGELAVTQGEVLAVMEMDLDNSGWTRLCRDQDEGYVPTAYIEMLE